MSLFRDTEYFPCFASTEMNWLNIWTTALYIAACFISLFFSVYIHFQQSRDRINNTHAHAILCIVFFYCSQFRYRKINEAWRTSRTWKEKTKKEKETYMLYKIILNSASFEFGSEMQRWYSQMLHCVFVLFFDTAFVRGLRHTKRFSE